MAHSPFLIKLVMAVMKIAVLMVMMVMTIMSMKVMMVMVMRRMILMMMKVMMMILIGDESDALIRCSLSPLSLKLFSRVQLYLSLVVQTCTVSCISEQFTMQWNTMQCTAQLYLSLPLQTCTVQCNTVQYSAMQCTIALTVADGYN